MCDRTLTCKYLLYWNFSKSAKLTSHIQFVYVTAVFIKMRKSIFEFIPSRHADWSMDHVARGLKYLLFASPLSALSICIFMARKKSNDLKARVPILYFREGYKVKDICRILGLGKTLVYECIQNYVRHHRHHSLYWGRPRLVKHAHVNFVRQLLSTRHSLYLDELQTELFQAFHIRFSLSTISRTLHRTSLSRKRLWKQAIGVSSFQN